MPFVRFKAHSPSVAGRPVWLATLALGVAWALLTLASQAGGRTPTDDFNGGWRFHLGDAAGAERPEADDAGWLAVRLPHTPRIEAAVVGADGPGSEQWQGICWYRKHWRAGEHASGERVQLRLGAAMRTVQLWVNGQPLGEHVGDYLPVALDITAHIRPGGENCVALRLDNRDNADLGPKPIADLDFYSYGGLYRGAELRTIPPLHFTDADQPDSTAESGVLVTFPQADADEALAVVRAQFANLAAASTHVTLHAELRDADGRQLAEQTSPVVEAAPYEACTETLKLKLKAPRLWSPADPYLHRLRLSLVSEGQVVDVRDLRVGVRRFEVTKTGLKINGRPTFLRGVNRHQEHPYVGYAVPNNAQWRDAHRIKEAGFDYVRLSHYPQSPAFLEACDELGLVVTNSILGWQFYRESAEFRANQLRQCRRLVRRDRNHACVLLWEASLNEAAMPADFVGQLHRATHEELPGDQCFTAGWLRGYDVYLQARQHGGCRDVDDVPCVVSEYGDWEYYAQNAGLNQSAWRDLQPEERTSRQDITAGDVRLLQQASNFQEAHNDNLKTAALGDGLWVMFDYNRGYSPDLETSGCMDLFRLPKHSYYFFKSQRPPDIAGGGAAASPMVYLANEWGDASPSSVRVFSNCEEVRLIANDVEIGVQTPDSDRLSTDLAHPPFTFRLPTFAPGSLRAEGIMDGRVVARHERRTPSAEAALLSLDCDLAGLPLRAGVDDLVFVRARLLDERGTTVSRYRGAVRFTVKGSGAELVGENPAPARAGVASILLRTNATHEAVTLTADTPDGMVAVHEAQGAISTPAPTPDETTIFPVGRAIPAGGQNAAIDSHRRSDAPATEPIRLHSPKEWQVFQRQSVDEGPVLLSGRVNPEADRLEWRLDAAPVTRMTPEDWSDIRLDERGRFNVLLRLPSGGWYRLKLRAYLGDKLVAEMRVENFGVGEVFVGAGQSNSTNSGELRTEQMSGMVSAFDGSTWRLANDPLPGVADRSQGGSFWPAFGDAIHSRYHVPVGVASTGYAGTSVAQWQPGGHLFEETIRRVHQLGRSGFRALIWHQGESDFQTSSKVYYEHLKSTIEASRKRAGWEFPWLVAQASYHNPEKPAFNQIRDAQARLWNEGIALPGPDTDKLVGDHRDLGGAGTHFSPKGLKAHGELWGQFVGDLIDEQLALPRPAMTRSSRKASEADVQ